MRKEAVVLSVENGMAVLSVKRDSACGDCASCGGCNAGTIPVKVKNTLVASQGERVVIETASGTVIGIAAIVYLLPLICFFALYAIGSAVHFYPLLFGAFGFLAALAAAVILNRRFSRKTAYRMICFAEDAS